MKEDKLPKMEMELKPKERDLWEGQNKVNEPSEDKHGPKLSDL
jgi:hypothetical protein